MLRSMFSAISGLRAHQTKMDTVANNIANVNTVGFKTQNTVFETTLTQVLRSGKGPDDTEGGTNPAQVGLGVKLAAITTDFGQGKTQNTGRALDFMIQGDGFFVTKTGGQQLFTRAGSFTFDGAGKLITADGNRVQGWMSDADGTIDTGGTLEDLQVQYGAALPPKATTAVTMSRNVLIDPAAAAGANVKVAKATVYNQAGVEQRLNLTWTQQSVDNTNGNSQWTLSIANEDGTTPPAPVTADVLFTAGGTPTFSNLSAGAATTGNTLTVPGWGSPTGAVFDFAQVTAQAAGTAIAAVDQNGYTAGSLSSFSLSEDGTMTGVYTNNERRAIGKLAMATFDNPSGLINMGNTSYAVGDNSGVALIGAAGTGSLGTLSSGALEMSNVDLSEEFTGLIIAQRGFQANSRVISASDELLQDLVNLKR
ncbi:flagellar hook protein FlgE [Klenkia taihuensis]|uniref:Flagellar hook protein FlgE n=1 Tax=Klenkia taihuensis TaxID=1225127 RepID=A0A1I1MU79_9ACTN|nr:flagellar hook protein FlgE [Klenkia taihuensis]GHE14357.1 flagellar hook protein FlgE [Klenkia taihuensis]SFC86133.1 flagellar hook protein FlgE [Klenkia taihuensis]